MKILALIISALLASSVVYFFYSGGVHIYIVTGDGAHHIGAHLTDNSQPSSQPGGTASTTSSPSESNVSTESKELGTGSGGSPKGSDTSLDHNAKSDEATATRKDAITASVNSESRKKRFHHRRYRRYYRPYYYRRYNDCTCPTG
jgi:hypothetical protein